MKLFFSELKSDYSHYLYSYVIWAVPEPGETPADLFERGFLPASPKLDRFYLCRNLRVNLKKFHPSSENRRILRKGAGITHAIVPRPEFDYNEQRRQSYKSYADARFGQDIMSFQRLDTLFSNPVISHLLLFADGATGAEAGVVLLFLQPPRVAYYYYAFYDLNYTHQILGMFMMTKAVELLAEQGFTHVYLGTCYSQQARYKTQFPGIEFFTGFRWSTNLAELKYLIERDQPDVTKHLLATDDYAAAFYGGSLDQLFTSGGFRTPG